MRETQVTTAKPVELLKIVSGVNVPDFQESAGNLLFIPFYSLDMLNFQLSLLCSPFQTIGSNLGFPCFREFTIPQESKPSDLFFLNLSNTIHVSLFSTALFRRAKVS